MNLLPNSLAMLITFLFQVALPLAMIAWLARAPANGWLAWSLQVLAIAATLLGMTLSMLWAMPPYWTPYLYWMLFGFVLVRQLVQGRPDSAVIWGLNTWPSVGLAIALLLGLLGVYLTVTALRGRLLPEAEVVDVAAPFPPGTYLVAHGGSTVTVNGHLETLNPALERFRDYRGQSRAVDIFRLGPAGLHVRGLRPRDPSRYVSFGTPLLAPCAGIVARVVDGVADNSVPVMNREQMAGNFVAIDCGEHHIVLAHFRQGSIRVSEGQAVTGGEPLGELGNSGNSSEPHLHIHAQRGLPEDAPLNGEPLPLRIDGRFLVRNDRLRVMDN